MTPLVQSTFVLKCTDLSSEAYHAFLRCLYPGSGIEMPEGTFYHMWIHKCDYLRNTNADQSYGIDVTDINSYLTSGKTLNFINCKSL